MRTMPMKMPSNAPQIRAAAQQGTTLVEVLVTLVLISVGLLGVAALQLTSLKSNQEAYVRSQASLLASDILDRMRANQDAVRKNEYVVALNNKGVAGTPAGNDLTAWQQTIDQMLPGGAALAGGQITRLGNVVTVTIQWGERALLPVDPSKPAALPSVVTFQTRSEI